VAIDPAARDLVDRQRADRHDEVEQLAAHLRRAGRLRPGVTARQALALIMVFNSYETYRELREVGLSEREIARELQRAARAALLA
jgi:hypothetical protein